MWTELVLITLLFWIIYNSFKKPSNYPPGLWGWPILGYIPLGKKKFDKKLEELKSKYEKMFCWKIGERLMVFIHDFETIKDSFKSIDLVYRPQVEYLTFIIGNYHQGLTLANGPYWHSLRRFTLRHLRDLGMGKSRLVTSVQYEASELVNAMKKTAGEAKPLSSDIRVAVINVIWQMLASKRFEFDEIPVLRYDNALAKYAATFEWVTLVDIFPSMKSVLPRPLLNILTKRNDHEQLMDVLKSHVKTSIDEHAKTLDINNPRDYIDEFLIEIKKEKNSKTGLTLSEMDLVVSLSDIFGAAFQTTATTMIWGLFYLAKFPHVQKRMQKEIDEVLPNGTQVTLEDKLRLPYTEAFINEVLRCSALNRFILPRTVIKDTKIGENIVPKDSVIFGFTEAVHFDSKYYDSPKEFRPERFLNDAGKFEAPKEGFLAFGIGKRLCMGESLARMELLIFLTTLVQHLEFSPPKGETIELESANVPVLNMPNFNQKLLISVRKAD
ncbi:UNVERIFIED_CONTAM: hypothetical protein RMT77_009537 [Armadillidium vulgare]